MQIKLRRASLAEPSERSSAATRLIANIFQRTDLVRRHCNSPLDGPRTVPAIPHAYRLRPLRSSPEIQPAFNTHRSRSGRRFCPIDF